MKVPIIQRLSVKNKKLVFLILFALFTTILFFTIPYFSDESSSRQDYRSQQLQLALQADSFEEFSQALFCYEVTCDSITSAYLLRNPDNYNIPTLIPTLSSFALENYQTSKRLTGATNDTTQSASLLLNKLSSFSTENLSSKETLTYTLLKNTLETNTSFQEFAYYDELLGSTTGVQANLPVTLCEYPLNNYNDVKTYLTLLKQVPSYFESIIEYEEYRSSLNYNTPAFLKAETLSSLTSFINSLKTKDNCFSQTFIERINDIPSLTKEDKQNFLSTNQNYIQQYILPAYESLFTYLESNSPSSTLDPDVSYGLSSLPRGDSYYELLVSQNTGSSNTVEELIARTDEWISDIFSNVLMTATTNPEVYFYYCEHPLESYYESPESMLEALSLLIQEDYPLLETTPTYSIKTVSTSLQDSLSPAFYMIPALDDFKNNTIYINPSYTQSTGATLFTTLAHEGFPGHLYQTVYFNETNPLPLRHLLDYPGYVEGWATYVEINAFQYLDYPFKDELFCSLYQWETILSLALSARVDLGVNYENWTLNDAIAFFDENGLNSEHAESLYTYVVEAPANYLRYFIGYTEIIELKESYRLQTMENYSEKEFHEKFLDIGPADFETVRNYLFDTTHSK